MPCNVDEFFTFLAYRGFSCPNIHLQITASAKNNENIAPADQRRFRKLIQRKTYHTDTRPLFPDDSGYLRIEPLHKCIGKRDDAQLFLLHKRHQFLFRREINRFRPFPVTDRYIGKTQVGPDQLFRVFRKGLFQSDRDGRSGRWRKFPVGTLPSTSEPAQGMGVPLSLFSSTARL